MTGSVGILNIGAGDTKLSFDRSNPAEALRAARIVKDMLRRGYALLVEIEQPDGTKSYQRALDFREDTAEYIIADFSPEYGNGAPAEPLLRTGLDDGPSLSMDPADEQQSQPEAPSAAEAPSTSVPRRGRRRLVPASATKAVAVARTAGG